MKRIAILQSNYIPWKGYFDLINSVDESELMSLLLSNPSIRDQLIVKGFSLVSERTVSSYFHVIESRIFTMEAAMNCWDQTYVYS